MGTWSIANKILEEDRSYRGFETRDQFYSWKAKSPPQVKIQTNSPVPIRYPAQQRIGAALGFSFALGSFLTHGLENKAH